MNANEKAARGGNPNGFNQNLNFTGGKSNGLDVFNYRQNRLFNQCLKCGSDYMRFSKDGFCQDCQQRVEFIVRERPQVLRRVQNQESRREVAVL
jgi:DNA-directed RNA polymerase subunit RPC12/RpoP